MHNSFLGDLIGKGSNRHVYECALRNDLVIKYETKTGLFHNVIEHEVWKMTLVNDLPLKKYLAPVHSISDCGRWLIMHKTTPVNHEEYPDELPRFFWEMGHDNFGMFDNRFVCHDYALNAGHLYGLSDKLTPARWGMKDKGPYNV